MAALLALINRCKWLTLPLPYTFELTTKVFDASFEQFDVFFYNFNVLHCFAVFEHILLDHLRFNRFILKVFFRVVVIVLLCFLGDFFELWSSSWADLCCCLLVKS